MRDCIPSARLHSVQPASSRHTPSPDGPPPQLPPSSLVIALVIAHPCHPPRPRRSLSVLPSLLVIVVGLIARYLPRCWCGDPHCLILGSPCPRPCRVFRTGLGSCYPGVCRIVGIGLVSLLWGCARHMRLASLSWVSPCRR